MLLECAVGAGSGGRALRRLPAACAHDGLQAARPPRPLTPARGRRPPRRTTSARPRRPGPRPPPTRRSSARCAPPRASSGGRHRRAGRGLGPLLCGLRVHRCCLARTAGCSPGGLAPWRRLAPHHGARLGWFRLGPASSVPRHTAAQGGCETLCRSQCHVQLARPSCHSYPTRRRCCAPQSQQCAQRSSASRRRRRPARAPGRPRASAARARRPPARRARTCPGAAPPTTRSSSACSGRAPAASRAVTGLGQGRGARARTPRHRRPCARPGAVRAGLCTKLGKLLRLGQPPGCRAA